MALGFVYRRQLSEPVPVPNGGRPRRACAVRDRTAAQAGCAMSAGPCAIAAALIHMTSHRWRSDP